LNNGSRLENSSALKEEKNVKSFDPVIILKGLDIDKSIIEKFSNLSKNDLKNEKDVEILDNCLIS
jgi:hypothetical protein